MCLTRTQHTHGHDMNRRRGRGEREIGGAGTPPRRSRSLPPSVGRDRPSSILMVPGASAGNGRASGRSAKPRSNRTHHRRVTRSLPALGGDGDLLYASPIQTSPSRKKSPGRTTASVAQSISTATATHMTAGAHTRTACPHRRCRP